MAETHVQVSPTVAAPSPQAPRATRVAPRLRWAWAIVLLVAAGGAVSGWWRGLGERPDWRDFRSESRYVWEHGRAAPGTAMFGYLPGVAVLLWPFAAWTPNAVGVTLFVGTNVACAALAMAALARRWTGAAQSLALAAALLLGCVNLAHALQSNQMTLWTMALVVGGLTLVCGPTRGHGGPLDFPQWTGGLLLGAAAAIKTIPLLLAAYLLLTRRWRAAGAMLAGLLLVDLAPSLVAYGPAGMLREHRAWLTRIAWHSNGVQIDDPLLRVHRHGSNQSYSAVLARWLRDTGAGSTQVIVKGDAPPDDVRRVRASLGPGELLSLDPMPPRHAEWELLRKDISHVPRFHIASLPPAAVRAIWATTLLAAFAALGVATWRTRARADAIFRGGAGFQPARRAGSPPHPCLPLTPATRGLTTGGDWTPAAALWMLAMLWPSPMMRDYYLVWALPALLVVCRALTAALADGERVVGHSSRVRWTPGMRLAAAAIWMWIIGLACLAVDVAMWYGIHLLALALLAAATAWAWRRGAKASGASQSTVDAVST